MRKHSNGRIRRSRSEWQEILERFEASGLSKAEFCRQEGIAKGSFSRWMPQVAVDRGAARDEGAFVELTGPRPAPVASLGAGELELFLPGGVRLRWKV